MDEFCLRFTVVNGKIKVVAQEVYKDKVLNVVEAILSPDSVQEANLDTLSLNAMKTFDIEADQAS